MAPDTHTLAPVDALRGSCPRVVGISGLIVEVCHNMLPLYDASEDGHRGGACVSVIVQLVSPVHVSARTLAKVATAALSFRRHSPTTGQASTCGPHVAPGTAPMLSVSRLRG